MIRIDLRKDAGDVQALLAKAVREYCAEQKGGAPRKNARPSLELI